MKPAAAVFRRAGLTIAATCITTVLAGCATGLESLPLPAPGQIGANAITVTAAFANAMNLPQKAKIKLNGADIGEVESIRTRDFTAYVTMRINADVALYTGATAQLRSATPLGDIFVAIRLDPNKPPARGACMTATPSPWPPPPQQPPSKTSWARRRCWSTAAPSTAW